jgi:hypothetical protein
MRSLSTASRIHIDAAGVSVPRARYSAMPSMNQSGWLVSRPECRAMSNWKACTSSWPSTRSVSASVGANGITMRRRAPSVTPPIESDRMPETTLVCENSAWLP